MWLGTAVDEPTYDAAAPRAGPTSPRKGPVLVLLSFALVLLAAVLLLVGLAVDSGLALIYASIGCSLAAGVLLILATRAQRGASTSGRPGHDAETLAWGRRVGPVPSGDEDYLFPIGQYEQRPVAEILPLLAHLYEDELDMVEARERRGASRDVVLTRVEEARRRYRGAAGPGGAPPPPPGGPAGEQAS